MSWVIILTVGLPVQILTLYRTDLDTDTMFIALKIHIISSYTSSIVAIVWVSFIKRREFLELLENISKAGNKIRYTQQEEPSRTES